MILEEDIQETLDVMNVIGAQLPNEVFVGKIDEDSEGFYYSEIWFRGLGGYRCTRYSFEFVLTDEEMIQTFNVLD